MPFTMRLFVCLVFGLFLFSCSSRQIPPQKCLVKKIAGDTQESIDYVRQQEARLDIPFPLSLQPIQEKCIDASMLTFHTETSVDELLAFYERNMEGWRLETRFIGKEHLLIFDRPESRTCGISIRPCDDMHITELVVFIGTKNNDS